MFATAGARLASFASLLLGNNLRYAYGFMQLCFLRYDMRGYGQKFNHTKLKKQLYTSHILNRIQNTTTNNSQGMQPYACHLS